MGDATQQPGAPAESPQPDVPAASVPVSSTTGQSQPLVMSSGSLSFPSSHPLPFQYGAPQHGYAPQVPMAQPQSLSRAGPFDMNGMANALPQPGYVPGPYGRGARGYHQTVTGPGPGMTSPLAPTHFAGQNTMNMMPSQQYYLPQHTHMTNYYPGGMVVGQQPHPSQYYYPHQAAHFTAQPAHTQAPQVPSQYIPPAVHQPEQPLSPADTAGEIANAGFSAEQSKVSGEGRASTVRGPPRKPRQKDYAVWIGNLPAQVDLMSLVHHVCEETDGLQSLFLIRRTNCAFANFKDEEACVAGQRRLHNSKFQSLRLASRLRKSTVQGATGVTAPTGPAASSAPLVVGQDSEPAGEGGEGEEATGAPTAEEAKTMGSPADGGSGPKDRFFILKSLTVEDLELSVRTGTWATQSHNEETLNSAFAKSDNVYLVFSANKSGEYFGYARMTSPIDDDPAAAIQFAPTAPTSSEVELPRAIPTEATEFTPKGRIIDDSARGTIFWEAEREGSTVEEEGPTGGDTGSAKSGDEDTGAETRAWGKPFRLQWLSTARLPFYRTRGLRNPWNSNREVKIARDGTELQPAVGRRLIGLFNQVQGPAALGPASSHAHVSSAYGGGAIPIQGPVMPTVPTVGFPPMRPGSAYQPR